MASQGVFNQTADTRATQYMGTVARDKGMGEPGPKEQLNRYYGRSEHQPYMNPYHGRPVIDQTLGDQFGSPKYELDVGMQIKNIIMADAEQPWMTIIMPLNNTDALTITGSIWKFNRRLPRPTPYHAPSPYVTEEYEQFYGQIQRYGESIRMESDFYHTEEGMRNFALKLTGIASDMIEGIRYDVLREMIRAIEEYKRYYNLHTYTEDPTKDIRSRVTLFAALNKAPTRENQLGVTIERLERALKDVVPGPFEVICPPEWGIFFHSINQTPAPQPYYFMGDIMVENGPTPKGQIGDNRYWEYPDIVVETGAPRLRILDRKVIVAEYYQSIFKEGNSALCMKLTGLLSSDKDIGRMRNIWVYSADEDKYVEVELEDMVKYSALVPDSYKTTTSDKDPMRHSEMFKKLLEKYNSEGEKAIVHFHPEGDIPAGAGRKRSVHNGISGSIRTAPVFLMWEPKDLYKDERGRVLHARKVKYSGETDHNVQSYRDHVNQGDVLCAQFIHHFLGMSDIGARYNNAIRLRSALRDAPITTEFARAFILANIGNSLTRTTDRVYFTGSTMYEASDYVEYGKRWGMAPIHRDRFLATNTEGHYIIPPRSETGVDVPPGCDSAIGLASLARLDPNTSGYNSSIISGAIEHYSILLSMVEQCKDLPSCELINPLNRAPWVHTTNEEVSRLDYAYSTAVSQPYLPVVILIPTTILLGEDEAEILELGPNLDNSKDEEINDKRSSYGKIEKGFEKFIPSGALAKDTDVAFREGDDLTAIYTALSFTPGILESIKTQRLNDVSTLNAENGYTTILRTEGIEQLYEKTKRNQSKRMQESFGDYDDDDEDEDDDDEGDGGDETEEGSSTKKTKGKSPMTEETFSGGGSTQLLPDFLDFGSRVSDIKIKKWMNGEAKNLDQYPHNFVHGTPYGMSASGQFPRPTSVRKSKGSGKSSIGSYNRERSGTIIRTGMLRSTRSSERRRGERNVQREIPSLSDHASQDLDFLSAGAKVPAERDESEATLFDDDRGWGASKTLDEYRGSEILYDRGGILRTGYRMVMRFNGSNFIHKMREVTMRMGDPTTFFTIACMKSRQDRKEDLLKLVKNRLHVAFNFLLFRLPELHMESAILCKAGLGMTVVNNSDFKNGETISTKTYHGHLTVHFGAIVTHKDWQLMLEDLRCNGYIQGKGTGFLRSPNDLLAASRSQGKRNRSFICYAQPISKELRQLPPMLSLSGQWEMPDVVPANLPQSGKLFHGCDWYDMIWKWHENMTRDRPKQIYFRSKGYTWPQVALMGWHAEYNLNQGRFQIASHGTGHLAGSDYPGAVAVLNGDASWFDPPPKSQLELY